MWQITKQCLIFCRFITLVACDLDINVEENTFTKELSTLLDKIYMEKSFETILLLRHESSNCVDDKIGQHLNIPQIVLTTKDGFYIKGYFGSELIAIICLDTLENLEILDSLAINLDHMRQTRVVSIVNYDYSTKNNTKSMELFFKKCEELKLLNINLFFLDFSQTHEFYTYTLFPDFQLISNRFTPAQQIFPYRLGNLYGKTLKSLLDFVEPRTMLYTDPNGKQILMGYAGRFMDAFAHHLNFTLKYPPNMPTSRDKLSNTVRSAVKNGSIDIGISFSGPSDDFGLLDYSYPVETVAWLTMVPDEQPIEIRTLLTKIFRFEFLIGIFVVHIFFSVLLTYEQMKNSKNVKQKKWASFLMKVLFNDTSMRGILGQAFQIRRLTKLRQKWTYFQIFIVGLFISTAFSATLVRFLTAPPTDKPVSSFDDLLGKDLKIVVRANNVEAIKIYNGEKFWSKYSSIFDIVRSDYNFQASRMALDKNRAFCVTTSTWPMYAEKQKYYSRKAFRLAPELCINSLIFFAVPIEANSFYRDPLNRMIFAVRDAGLINYWIKLSVYDLVVLGKIQFDDPTNARTVRAMNAEDLHWIWILYGVGVSISVAVFCAERIHHQSKKSKKIAFSLNILRTN